ncbi:TlpA disulfide reductase family protein [Gramella sp. AN32]|uniref:TlpA family protein disulfide reductase n=1 Tax=Christiangramia antarctica TaxID=2058158 RepID=A0ABW5X372_9FLAO|nr:TlpA disulfide reductase family protein [Gramella sp. AN32]MCM4157651.1 thiol-disulfide oxidoreductase [Gramella sp. AN32]
MDFLKKEWTNILLIGLLVIMVIPQTRKPVQIFFNRIVAFAPGITSEDDRDKIENYNWVLEDSEKNRIEFKDYQDKIIIVNFWATWCPPCIAEMPDFEKLHTDYKDKINFFFVSNERHQTVAEFFEKNNYHLPNYKMLTQAPNPMQGNTLPTTFVIDRNGYIIVQKVGSANWNSESFRKTLDKLIAED